MTHAKKESDEEWRRKTRPIHVRHAWMTVRARQLVDDTDLSNDEIRTIVDYVYEQTMAHLFELTREHGKRKTLALDVALLESIIILGHRPNKDLTPIPKHWNDVE